MARNKRFGTNEIAWWVKALAAKHEDPGLITKFHDLHMCAVVSTQIQDK